MKKITLALIFSLLFISLASAQEVNNSNYYKFKDSGGSLNWLRASDAVPMIIDELLKKGIAYHTIGVGTLMMINDSTSLVVTVDFKKEDKTYGFVYEASHGLPLNVRDRSFLSDRKMAYCVQSATNPNGGTRFMRIEPMPEGVFLLKETCYWWEFDSDGTKFPVTKTVAEKILREDVDAYLAGIK
jgi:hypothetical protein